MGQESSQRLQEHPEAETVQQRRKQGTVRQTIPDEQRRITEFLVPRPRNHRTGTQRVMTDETNLPHSRLPCKRNLLEPAHCLKSRLPPQVHCSFVVVIQLEQPPSI